MERKPYTSERTRKALGALLALLSLLVLLSPPSRLAPLAFPFYYLLGAAGIWILLPWLILAGALLFLFGRLPRPWAGKTFWIALPILVLGLSSLLGVIAEDMGRLLDIGYDLSYWNSLALSTLEEGMGVLMYADALTQGGLLGFGIGKLLAPAGIALGIFLSVLLLLVGLLVLALPLIRFLMRKSKGRLRFQNIEEEEPSAPEEKGGEAPRLVIEEKEEPLDPQGEEAPASRSELYFDLPEDGLPREAAPRTPSETPIQDGGLRPADFLGAFRPGTSPREDPEPLPHDETPAKEPLAPPSSQPVLPPVPPVPGPEERKPSTVPEIRPIPQGEAHRETLANALPSKKEEPFREEPLPSLSLPPEPEKPAEEKGTAGISMDSGLDAPVFPGISRSEEETSSVRPAGFGGEVPAPTPEPPAPPEVPILGPALTPEEIALAKLHQPRRKERPPYELPSLDLLKTYGNEEKSEALIAECEARKAAIDQAFRDLNVGASIASYTIGPSVTRYDIQTERNVSVSTIGRYIADLSVRVGGVATRYEPIVMGSSYSGLEIANEETTTVGLREMIEAMPPREKRPFSIPFGKSISGKCLNGNLAEFPHMLVAGTSGSGKSIFMHGLIMSLIIRNRPEDLKLVIIDPKQVEMSKYRDIPHLLCPIITDAHQAKACLERLIEEMNRRYDLLSLAEVSKISEFNEDYAEEHGVEPLPEIVCIIDEYADLSDSCKDIGAPLLTLAQKARAAGINLVVATQRPSVNVITGTIKANLLVRVALAVTSAVDSGTILDQGGAENLIGKGDMLVSCTELSRTGLVRAQGCYVSNREIKAVCDFIRGQMGPDYDPRFLHLDEGTEDASGATGLAPSPEPRHPRPAPGMGDEDLYQEIRRSVMALDYCSVSWLRRNYGLGFPKAGSIMDRLKKEGIVAELGQNATSSKGSKVLIHSEEELEGAPAPEDPS